MNEKDRILNLVKQGVLSMEEALTLLEASASTSDIPIKETPEEIKSSRDEQKESSIPGKESFEDIADKLVATGKNLGNKLSKLVQEKRDQHDNSAQEVDFSEAYLQDQAEEQERFFKENKEPDPVENGILEDVQKEFMEKQALLHEKTQAHMIAQQRLRELEIFQEIDDLSEDMQKQQSQFQEEISTLELEIQEITDALAQLDAQKAQLGVKPDTFSSEHLKEKAGEFTKSTLDFADEALKEGQRFSKDVFSQVKGLVKNFNMKDVNLSFEVPWVKTHNIDHVFEYDGQAIQEMEFKLLNGSLEIYPHDSDTVEIESELRFHGNFEQCTVEEFETLSTISNEAGKFIFHVTSPRLSMDATVYVPEKYYENLKVQLTNGDLIIEGITAKEMTLNNKNGEVEIEEIDADLVEISNMNGDILMLDVSIPEIMSKNIAGNIRLTGEIQTVNIETVSGDILITKDNETSSNIQAKTISGDVKISQPHAMSLKIDGQSKSGQIYQRLQGEISKELRGDQNAGTIFRDYGPDAQLLDANIRVVSGDIWLKDHE